MTLETRQRRFMAEINVIPLVDVVLVLLVIFMVTAPMLYRGMDITLPNSASNTIKPEIRAVLTIEKDQRLYLDKDQVSVVQLERKLRPLKDRAGRCVAVSARRSRRALGRCGASDGWGEEGGHREAWDGDGSHRAGAGDGPFIRSSQELES